MVSEQQQHLIENGAHPGAYLDRLSVSSRLASRYHGSLLNNHVARATRRQHDDQPYKVSSV